MARAEPPAYPTETDNRRATEPVEVLTDAAARKCAPWQRSPASAPWDAIVQSGGKLRPDLALRCYANEDDYAGLYAYEREGDHPFADYAANGSVREGFEFVMASLWAC
ncbi:MAG: hypothetical protein ABI689_04935 [Thermoanaerobaculia bacterium]